MNLKLVNGTRKQNIYYMKYIILLSFFLTLSFPGELKAQSFVGIQAGLNSAKFSGDSPNKFKYAGKRNLVVGVGFDLQLKEDIYLSFLPSYLNGSSKLLYPKVYEEEEVEVYEDSINFDFRSILIPVSMKILSDNKRWQFTAGVEFLLPIKLTADNSAEIKDLIDDIDKFNINMLFGIGYIIPIDKSKLVIDLMYSQGLNNIANNLNDPENLLPRIRFTSFRFSIGYFLPVGKNKFTKPASN